MERELGSSADPPGLNTAERRKQGITGSSFINCLALLGGTGVYGVGGVGLSLFIDLFY
jgi:hypothetical protein